MYKGNLVKLVDTPGAGMRSRSCWRRLSSEERNAWYKTPDAWGHDDAGEPKLAPLDEYIIPVPERIYTVFRGRVNAPCGYQRSAGCLQLLDTHTGTIFYSKRENFKNVN